MSFPRESYELVTFDGLGMDLVTYRPSTRSVLESLSLPQKSQGPLPAPQGESNLISSCSSDFEEPRIPMETSYSTRYVGYASSASATDQPHLEMDQFPSVARVARSVRMNPLAKVFTPGFDFRTGSFDSNAEIMVADNELTSPCPQIGTSCSPVSQAIDLAEPTKKTDESSADTAHTPSRTVVSPQAQSLPIYSEHCRSHDQQRYYTSLCHADIYFQARLWNEHNVTAISRSLNSEMQTLTADMDPGPFSTIQSQNADHPFGSSGQRQASYKPHRFSPDTFFEVPQQHSYTTAYPSPPFSNFGQSINYPLTPVPMYFDCPMPMDGNSSSHHAFPRPYNNTLLAKTCLAHFTQLYGTSPTHLPSLHALALTLAYDPHRLHDLDTIRKAQNFIKARYVNIFDLVDAGLEGRVVEEDRIWRSASALRGYSEREEKICPSEVGRGEVFGIGFRIGAEGNELWRWMLRKWY